MAEVDPIEYKRLRRDVGASDDVLTDILAQEYIDEAEERYPSDVTKMLAHARVIALREIRANAAMLGKYAQNQSEEDLTKVFDNLSVMLKEAIEEVGLVADPVESTVSPFFFGLASGTRGR